MKRDTHLVVGGNGFLGKILVHKLLEKKLKVKVLDKDMLVQKWKNVKYLQRNILDLDAKEPFFDDVMVVYHLAAFQYHSPLPRFGKERVFFENNVTGTGKVVRAARGVQKIVYVSTDMVYGLPQYVPMREEHPKAPIGAYGRSKVQAEQVIQESGIPFVILRPRLIIGRGRLGIFEKLFVLVRKGLPVVLIGGGKNRYQMISVYDCADACVRAGLAKVQGRVYNLGSDNPPAVRALMQDVIRQSHSRSVIVPFPAVIIKSVLHVLTALHISPLEKEQYGIADQDYVLDTSRAKEELGWVPRFRDEMMVQEAYQYYLSQE